MDRRLHQFLAVAEIGTVSGAAEMLNISQPTISVNLRRLEEDHGVTLFERSSRGVVLTEFGRILYDHAAAMKRLDDNARTEIVAARSNRDHGLRVGCGYAWWSFPMRAVVRDFKRDDPDRSVLVDVSSSLDGLRKVLAGDIAVFLGTEVEALKPELAVEFEPLFRARHAYFVREGHPLFGRPCTRQEIGRFERMDVVPVETGHLAIVDPRRRSEPLGPSAPPNVLSSNSMTVCIDLLVSSDAILGYPRALEAQLRAHRILPLEVTGRDIWETIGLYFLSERQQARSLLEIVDRISGVLDRGLSASPHVTPWNNDS